MVMELFIDAGRGESDPAILTQSNLIIKVIRDSIRRNFGECGLAASLGSLQGTHSFLKHLEPKSVLQLAPLIWDLLSLVIFSEVCESIDKALHNPSVAPRPPESMGGYEHWKNSDIVQPAGCEW
jgi:hypothetical protein